MVRTGTSAAFAVFAMAYFAMSFTYSFYSSNDRLGAGFFPRTVGAALVLATLLNLISDIRGHTPDEPNEYWKDIGIVVAMMIGFAYAMTLIGAVAGMFLFIMAVLFFLNREHPITNVLIAIGIPVFLHLLFRVWLNAPLPDGRFEVIPFMS